MDTTSPIHWSLNYFRTAGKHLLATIVTASYGFQFGCSTTPWKDHQVYFEMDPASCGYIIRIGHNPMDLISHPNTILFHGKHQNNEVYRICQGVVLPHILA
jgi:hypothetical protein